MLIIQRIYTQPQGHRIFATTKIGDKKIGLTLGEKVNIYENGETLFYSHNHELPESAGFKQIATKKVVSTQNRAQVFFPHNWFNKYCNDLTHVTVFYTEIGLFVKPYKGDE